MLRVLHGVLFNNRLNKGEDYLASKSIKVTNLLLVFHLVIILGSVTYMVCISTVSVEGLAFCAHMKQIWLVCCDQYFALLHFSIISVLPYSNCNNTPIRIPRLKSQIDMKC